MKKKDNDQNKVIIERVIDEELPPGWVKEIRIKKTSSGVRRDPLYNDTATGYVFRSRLDVFRYLETGEISKHAYKRKDGCRNDIQSMQVTASAATVRSNSNKGKETLQGSLLPNHCNSKVRETGSGTVSVGNNALLDLGDDVDVTPIKPKKVEGNENDVVRMDSDTKVSKSNEKRNDEKSSSRRSSSRLAGIETELVTHTVAIERVLRAANKKSAKNETMESSEPNQATQSQQTPQTPNVVSQEDTLRHCTEPVTVPSPNEIVGAGQIQLNEQCVLSGSKRKPERNRKKIVSPRPSSNLLAEIDVKPVAKPVAKPVTKPVIHSVATKRVLRSACSNSAKTEAVPSYGSEPSEQVKDATPVVNVASEEEIVPQYPESVKNDFFVAERIEENEECGNRRSRSRERKPKRNRKEIVSPITHASQRVKDETPVVNVGSEKEIVRQYPESASTPVKNVFCVAERIEDNEECGNRRSQSRERKPKRNRKEIVTPVTHAPQRVLRSASNKSSKTEDMRSLGSEQDNKGEAPPVINSREIVLAVSILPEDQVVKETSRCNSTDQTVIGVCMTVEPSRNNVEVERIEETPTRSIVEPERIKETPPRNNIEVERIKETPPRNNVEVERIKETPTRNNVEVERMKETPTRNNVDAERFKETPKHNPKNLVVTDEVTAAIDSNGKEKEQHDPHFSFPWSDPCIEFAYKTLTGALPLDDTLAIHDYVQHQIRTSSNPTKTFTHSDCRPSGFSLNTFPSNSSTSITFPDPGPPGFSRVPLVDARPPGFSLNDIPSDHSDVLILPDSGPPGFSRGNNLATPAGTPPGFSRSSLTPSSSNNFSVPDARPPQFSWSSVPPNSGNNPPGFPWSTSPRNSVNNPAVPEAKPPSSSWGSVPANIPAAKPAGPPGFPWSSVPSNSSNSPALPDAKPPGFSWSCVPPSSGIGINLNVALPDSGPPGFSQKIVPPAKQQHQQQTNPAGIGTQPAEFPFQGTMFSWNHRN